MAVKFNFQQISLKTLIPTMNTLKDMAKGTLTVDRQIFKYSQRCGLVLVMPSQTKLKREPETEEN